MKKKINDKRRGEFSGTDLSTVAILAGIPKMGFHEHLFEMTS